MKTPMRIAVCGTASLAVVACTDLPTMSGHSAFSTQQHLASIKHWDVLAEDVVNQLYPKTNGPLRGSSAIPPNPPGQAPAKVCIEVHRPDRNASQFQIFLADAITTDIVNRKFARVADSKDGCKAIVGTDSTATTTIVSIDSVEVVKHERKHYRPFPGNYTILATGIVVVRHLVRHFSEAGAVVAVAAAETAYWATSGLRSKASGVEVAVTVSDVSQQHEYLSRFTNTYYIDDDDAKLYAATPPKAVAEAQKPAPDTSDDYQLPRLDPPKAPVAPATAKPSSLQIYPSKVSACDTHADLVIVGMDLATSATKYELGQVNGTMFTDPLAAYKPAESANGIQKVRVRFDGLQLADRGGDSLPLTMDGPQGVGTADVAIEDTCKSAAKPATKAAKIPTVAALQVYPTQLSACATHAEFTVIGTHLANSGDSYQLGQATANPLDHSPSQYDASTFQKVRLSFDDLDLPHQRVRSLPLTMNGPDGVATGKIGVVGTCAARAPAPAQPPAAPMPAAPRPAGAPKAPLAPVTTPTSSGATTH
jgi:hypothetical protein